MGRRRTAESNKFVGVIPDSNRLGFSYTDRSVLVWCDVCRRHFRQQHTPLAVIEHGVPDLSREPFRRPRGSNSYSRYGHGDPCWWVRVLNRTSYVALEHRKGTAKAGLVRSRSSEVGPAKEKVVDELLRFGDGVELRCSDTRCSNAPGFKVRTLVEMAQDALLRREREIFVPLRDATRFGPDVDRIVGIPPSPAQR
jgi:hypothetical protein